MFPIEYVHKEKLERGTLGLNVQYSKVQMQDLTDRLFGGLYIYPLYRGLDFHC